MIPVLAFYRAPANAYAVLVGIAVLMFVVPYATPILLQPRGTPWAERSENARREQADRVRREQPQGLERARPEVVRAVLIALYMLALFWVAGDSSALYRQQFLVKRDADPPQALLVNYGDLLIFAPFDPDTKELSDERIIETVGDPSLVLEWQMVGPLDSGVTDYDDGVTTTTSTTTTTTTSTTTTSTTTTTTSTQLPATTVPSSTATAPPSSVSP